MDYNTGNISCDEFGDILVNNISCNDTRGKYYIKNDNYILYKCEYETSTFEDFMFLPFTLMYYAFTLMCDAFEIMCDAFAFAIVFLPLAFMFFTFPMMFFTFPIMFLISVNL